MEKEVVEKLVNEIMEVHFQNDEKRYAITHEMIKENHQQVRDFIIRADPVILAFNHISTTGKLTTKIIFMAAKLTIALGVIIGTIIALKEWIKK